MTGVLGPDATVRFTDPAESSSIYAKGFFGTPAADGGLTLDRYEAVYLSEMGRAEIATPSGRAARWPEVFRRAVRADPGTRSDTSSTGTCANGATSSEPLPRPSRSRSSRAAGSCTKRRHGTGSRR